MLICLKRINDKRISGSEEGEAKRRKLNDGVVAAAAAVVVM